MIAKNTQIKLLEDKKIRSSLDKAEYQQALVSLKQEVDALFQMYLVK